MSSNHEICTAVFAIRTGDISSQEVVCPGSEYCLWVQASAADSDDTSYQRTSGQCVREQKIYAGGG